ncbi:MAG: anhydro-N-acetylmuramic acid kinase [Pseudomonadota bacterium]
MAEIKTAIGLMSGTSMDGIDVALVKTDGESVVERGASAFFPYSAAFRKRIGNSLETAKQIIKRIERPGNLSAIEMEITDLHVEAVNEFLRKNELSSREVDVLGFHGQTVLHRPDEALTVQLGDGQKLAAETGIKTVFDMRAKDMEHGGQGAPMIPVYHHALTANLPNEYSAIEPVAFVNIGGISNISYVGEELIAFDTGPGNALIDQWVQRNVGIPYDDGGIIAAEGMIEERIVSEYMGDPFFNKPVPKSLDRNDFELPENPPFSVETVARSLARVTAQSIFRAVEHFPVAPKLWIICGGGRLNPHIMRDLRQMGAQLDSEVILAEEAELNGDSMEAEAWGYLSVRSIKQLPLTFPKTTGVKSAIHGGLIRTP